MRHTILCVLAIGLMALPSTAAAETPPLVDMPPSAPATTATPAATPPAPRLAVAMPRKAPPPIPAPAADPLMEIGAAGLIGSAFAIVVLIACGASTTGHAQTQCLEASGFSALGLLAVGIPFTVIANRQSSVSLLPYVERLTFTAGARSGTVGWRWTF